VSGVFPRSGNRCVIDVAVRNEGTYAGGCIVASDSSFADWSGISVATRMTCNTFARVNESSATGWKMARCFESPGEGWGPFTWCGNKMRKRIERTWAGIGRVVR
jgi:hypothetical protein